jgi:hypothetical protein
MRAGIVLAVGLAALGCAQARGPGGPPDYSRPYEVVLSEYSVPVALGTAMRGTVGGWEEGFSSKRFVQGITHRPVAHDVDNGFVNYVLHPLSGSETHMIARNHGWTFGESFLFDAWASLMWEYVFENVYEPPSRIDLMVTAPVGALLGELRWQAKRAGILPGLMDPLGDHGEPFLELAPEGILFGLQRRF